SKQAAGGLTLSDPPPAAKEGWRSVSHPMSTRLGPDIGRGWADHPPGALLFERVRDPGRRAGDREDRRERLARQADGIEQQRGIELDIGLKAAAGLAALERRDRATLHVLREGK